MNLEKIYHDRIKFLSENIEEGDSGMQEESVHSFLGFYKNFPDVEFDLLLTYDGCIRAVWDSEDRSRNQGIHVGIEFLVGKLVKLIIFQDSNSLMKTCTLKECADTIHNLKVLA